MDNLRRTARRRTARRPLPPARPPAASGTTGRGRRSSGPAVGHDVDDPNTGVATTSAVNVTENRDSAAAQTISRRRPRSATSTPSPNRLILTVLPRSRDGRLGDAARHQNAQHCTSAIAFWYASLSVDPAGRQRGRRGGQRRDEAMLFDLLHLALKAAFAVLSWLRGRLHGRRGPGDRVQVGVHLCSAVLALSTESGESGNPFSVSTCVWMSELASHAWLLALSAADWPLPQPAAASSASATTRSHRSSCHSLRASGRA